MTRADEADVRVLVVDDQPPFRDAARAVIERLAGFAIVAEASSGESAIALAASVQPQLILMDINMGGMDGIQATAAITAAHPGTMVVLMSTYELGDLPPAARSSGAAAYINKDDFGGRVLRRLWADGGDATFRSA
jgi:two-component system invasion response regulator UvrY